MTQTLSENEYKKAFSNGKQEKALKIALDIRKFEIELYWKRAAYFWTFIGATLAGYVGIQATSVVNKIDLSIVLTCLGIVFSFGWLCVNRGSKHWQENWENHVDMLENEECGPIYKIVLTRPDPEGCKEWCKHIISGPSQISVSKINQIISIYVVCLWCGLLIYSLPPIDFKAPLNGFYIFLITSTIITCALFLSKFGATHTSGYKHCATLRSTHIGDCSQ